MFNVAIENLNGSKSDFSADLNSNVFTTRFWEIGEGARYLDFVIRVAMPWASTRNYEYSKLYYRTSPDTDFHEDRVICFRIEKNNSYEKIRIALPASLQDFRYVQFRLDAFPYCDGGRAELHSVHILSQTDDAVHSTRKANLRLQKQKTREQVVECERSQINNLQHLPESLCLEITPRCNLTCGHCATHGTPRAHEEHNAMPEIPPTFIQHLAANVFPSLTSVTAIGRGEPLYIEESTWQQFITALKENDVLLSVVTNGVLIRKRITPDLVPMIDTLTVSIDGLSQDVFGDNRGQASIDKVLSNVRYFHELRKSINLPRRPKLCLSWTMKKNNIGELLAFVDRVKEFEPDIMFTRHLMIFHESDVDQSLINRPDIANPILEKVYRRMKELGIKTECPPVAEDVLRWDDGHNSSSKSASRDIIVSDRPRKSQHSFAVERQHAVPTGDPCMFVYRTANIHTDGRIHVCPRPNAPYVGNFHETSFEDIWKGEAYQKVRNSLGTDGEFEECRHCWYRESKYHPQRFERDEANNQSFSVLEPVPFTEQSWDFRHRYVNIP